MKTQLLFKLFILSLISTFGAFNLNGQSLDCSNIMTLDIGTNCSSLSNTTTTDVEDYCGTFNNPQVFDFTFPYNADEDVWIFTAPYEGEFCFTLFIEEWGQPDILLALNSCNQYDCCAYDDFYEYDSYYEETVIEVCKILCRGESIYIAVDQYFEVDQVRQDYCIYVRETGTIVTCVYELDCDNAREISCGESDFYGTHDEPRNVYSYCNNTNISFDLGEVVYEITPDRSGIHTFSLTGVSNSADLDMFLLDDCDQNSCLADSDGFNSNAPDIIEYYLNVDQTYYLVVDTDVSGGGGESNYTLHVDCFGCDDAYPVDCSASFQDSNDPSSNLFPSTQAYDQFDHHDICRDVYDGCYNEGFGNNVTFSTEENFYYFNGADAYQKDIVIDIIPKLNNLDVDLFVYTYCEDGELDLCARASTYPANQNDAVLIEDVGSEEEYFIVVDGQSFSSSNPVTKGLYWFSVTCGEITDHNARPIICGETVTGNTENSENYCSYYCNCSNEDGSRSGGGNTGPEDLWYFDVSTTSEITIVLTAENDGDDLELFLLDEENVTVCNKNSRTRGSGNETITANLQPGRYYVVVDGYDRDDGAYSLSIDGCDRCDDFPPISGNDPILLLSNPDNYDVQSVTVSYPLENLNDGNFELEDSLDVSDLSSFSYLCPSPGCYYICVWYYDNGELTECCFKYCVSLPRYDCDYPVIVAGETGQFGQDITVYCEPDEGGEVAYDSPYDSTYITLNGEVVDTNFLEKLPFNEYEICCYYYDASCDYWSVCCKTVCVPYINPIDQCPENNFMSTNTNGVFEWDLVGDYIGQTVSITPDLPNNTVQYVPSSPMSFTGSFVVTLAEQGNYRVCIDYEGDGLEDCCEYICWDGSNATEDLCEDAFEITPIYPGGVKVNCTSDDFLWWEWCPVSQDPEVIIDCFFPNKIYTPMAEIDFIEGLNINICKVQRACCGALDYCCKEICYDGFNCNRYSPYYGGDGMDYKFFLGDDSQDLEPISYTIFDENDNELSSGTNFENDGSFSVDFNSIPGFIPDRNYVICYYFYDPFGGPYGNGCYRVCYQKYRIYNPFLCNYIIPYYNGSASNETYDYSFELSSEASGMEIQSWTILDDNGSMIDQYGDETNISWTSPDGLNYWCCVYLYDPVFNCYQICYIKLNTYWPYHCGYVVPYFTGDENNNSYSFEISQEAQQNGLEVVEWSVLNEDGTQLLDTYNQITDVSFPGGSTRVICVLLWDPITYCYQYCYYKIRLNNPYACGSIYGSYSYDNNLNDLQYSFTWDAPNANTEELNWMILSEDGQTVIDDGIDPRDYSFPSPGNYTVCLLYWNYTTYCYELCYYSICVYNPFTCNDIYYTYDGYQDESGVHSFMLNLPQNADPNSIDWMLHTSSGDYVLDDGFGAESVTVDFNDYPNPDVGNNYGVSVRYRINGFWKECCIKIQWTRNPSCVVFLPTYDPQTQTVDFNVTDNQIQDYYCVIGESGMINQANYVLPEPPEEDMVLVCCYYFDGNCWRVCCRYICSDGSSNCDGNYADKCPYRDVLDCVDFDSYQSNTPIDDYDGWTDGGKTTACLVQGANNMNYLSITNNGNECGSEYSFTDNSGNNDIIELSFSTWLEDGNNNFGVGLQSVFIDEDGDDILFNFQPTEINGETYLNIFVTDVYDGNGDYVRHDFPIEEWFETRLILDKSSTALDIVVAGKLVVSLNTTGFNNFETAYFDSALSGNDESRLDNLCLSKCSTEYEDPCLDSVQVDCEKFNPYTPGVPIDNYNGWTNGGQGISCKVRGNGNNYLRIISENNMDCGAEYSFVDNTNADDVVELTYRVLLTEAQSFYGVGQQSYFVDSNDEYIYLNFQPTVNQGDQTQINIFVTDVYDGNGDYVSHDFPIGKWFNVRMILDKGTSALDIFVADELVVSLSNTGFSDFDVAYFDSALSTDFQSRIDDLCLFKCRSCEDTMHPNPYNADCNDISIATVDHISIDDISVGFTYNGSENIEGWEVVDINSGNTVASSNDPNSSFIYDNFTRGRSYYICVFYYNEFNCLERCCMILRFPNTQDYFTAYYRGTTSTDYILSVDGLSSNQDLDSWWSGGTDLGNQDDLIYTAALNEDNIVSLLFTEENGVVANIYTNQLCYEESFDICNNYSFDGPQGGIIELSTNAENAQWSIPGLMNAIGSGQSIDLDLTDSDVMDQIDDQENLITVCLTYLEDDCFKTCCDQICIIEGEVDCGLFEVTVDVINDQFRFSLVDNNTNNPTMTEVELPNGTMENLSNAISTYNNLLEGEYVFTRTYLGGCGDFVTCREFICVNLPLECNPIAYEEDEDNPNLITFTQSTINGVEYIWDFGDGITSSDDAIDITHVYPFENASYTVCLTVVDICGSECVECVNVGIGIAVDNDNDGFDEDEDCDDNNPDVNPDADEIPYNGIDDDCDPLTPDDDLDGDGFDLANDCDDMNDEVNPLADEIPYNGLDDDCKSSTPDDDLDGDGFDLINDCDDSNPNINPDADEIPYNGIDDDCNGQTPDDDLDGDGFVLEMDCDDMNEDVNPGVDEIPYNGIDDDCDLLTPDDDLDGDGFGIATDCDDMNEDVNPGVDELPYNGIDDDCKASTPDDDLDGDGFLLEDDCDDTNENINPDAIEIPGNGIDEDCDGIDGTSAIKDVQESLISIKPNPATEYFIVDKIEVGTKLTIYNTNGKKFIKLFIQNNSQEIRVDHLPAGMYIISLEKDGDLTTKKLVVVRN